MSNVQLRPDGGAGVGEVPAAHHRRQLHADRQGQDDRGLAAGQEGQLRTEIWEKCDMNCIFCDETNLCKYLITNIHFETSDTAKSVLYEETFINYLLYI